VEAHYLAAVTRFENAALTISTAVTIVLASTSDFVKTIISSFRQLRHSRQAEQGADQRALQIAENRSHFSNTVGPPRIRSSRRVQHAFAAELSRCVPPVFRQNAQWYDGEVGKGQSGTDRWFA
jgi:hypothetical protein